MFDSKHGVLLDIYLLNIYLGHKLSCPSLSLKDIKNYVESR